MLYPPSLFSPRRHGHPKYPRRSRAGRAPVARRLGSEAFGRSFRVFEIVFKGKSSTSKNTAFSLENQWKTARSQTHFIMGLRTGRQKLPGEFANGMAEMSLRTGWLSLRTGWLSLRTARSQTHLERAQAVARSQTHLALKGRDIIPLATPCISTFTYITI